MHCIVTPVPVTAARLPIQYTKQCSEVSVTLRGKKKALMLKEMAKYTLKRPPIKFDFFFPSGLYCHCTATGLKIIPCTHTH